MLFIFLSFLFCICLHLTYSLSFHNYHPQTSLNTARQFEQYQSTLFLTRFIKQQIPNRLLVIFFIFSGESRVYKACALIFEILLVCVCFSLLHLLIKRTWYKKISSLSLFRGDRFFRFSASLLVVLIIH